MVRRCAALVAVALAGAALVLAPTGAAGAQEAPGGPTLHDVMEGAVDGLTATAAWDPWADDDGGITVRVEITNLTSADHDVVVPVGLLFATDDAGHQTLGTSGPEDGRVEPLEPAEPGAPAPGAAVAATVLHVGAGDTVTEELEAYCAEAEDGSPTETAEVRSLGVAEEPLTTVLGNIAALDPDPLLAQEAVWWVTDQPAFPVPDDIAPLLAGVDVVAFAADPHRVVPDTGYDPQWVDGSDRGWTPEDEEQAAGVFEESFDSGRSGGLPSDGLGSAGPGLALWVVLVAVGVVALVVVAARQGSRARPQGAAVHAGPPGWYPDPVDPRHLRWWDGRTWTAHRR